MELVQDVRASLGEGPVWVAAEECLYWLDILEARVFRYGHNSGGLQTYEPGCAITSLSPRAHGGFLGTTQTGFACFDSDAGLSKAVYAPVDLPASNRFNDGKTDAHGRYWAGTMDTLGKTGTGVLYRLDQSGSCWEMDTGYVIANGPAFNRAGNRLYHTDSRLGKVYVFDLDRVGEISNKQLFRQFSPEEGAPDGMTVDNEDCLWIACWGGWAVRRFSPSGELLETVEVPVSQVTSCAFGGPSLDELYVTSARVGLSANELASQPSAGGLFRFRPGVSGPNPTLCAY